MHSSQSPILSTCPPRTVQRVNISTSSFLFIARGAAGCLQSTTHHSQASLTSLTRQDSSHNSPKMSFLATTTTLSHTSPLPQGTTFPLALSMLSDYEFFLSCDPVLDSFTARPPNPSPDLPSAITSQIRTDAHQQQGISYTVIDIVHTNIWDSKVVSTYEFTDITEGVFVRIKSPMGIVMDTIWQVKKREDGGWELVEDLEIRCNRLLVGVVKGQCEEGWSKIHGKMIRRIEEDIKKANGN